MKHSRGSSPPPTQSEHDAHGDRNSHPSTKQNPETSRAGTPEKLTGVVSHPHELPDEDGRWQDDGGEGG